MITSKIKGGVNELVELLNDNKAKMWKLVYDADKTNGDSIFVSDDSACREDEIARMLRVIGNMDISRCVVVMYAGGDTKYQNPIKYEFSTQERDKMTNQYPAQISGIAGVPNDGYLSRADVDRMLNEREEKLSLKWKLEQLEDSRKEFERERKEFESMRDGVWGHLATLLKPIVAGLVAPSVSVAGLETHNTIDDADESDDDVEELQSEQSEQCEQGEHIETDSKDAYRLSGALKAWGQVDADYIDVICKLSEIVVSGKPIAGMQYDVVKNILMAM